MTVSSSPRGERPGRPGPTWETELRLYEAVVPEDGDESPVGWSDPPQPNRATRRRIARNARRNRKD
ncbi:hypothetical protein V2S66_03175 [Streptomyces sp. V4-01]|uniref:Uncharacterized protein n=1 Tax=Actinacidiphila polyblastidii TaxID=3110430 RepID=A0ABU7P598_9ACTN|nr:hypothetical protein [Streptomyces sp. V4-01]